MTEIEETTFKTTDDPSEGRRKKKAIVEQSTTARIGDNDFSSILLKNLG